MRRSESECETPSAYAVIAWTEMRLKEQNFQHGLNIQSSWTVSALGLRFSHKGQAIRFNTEDAGTGHDLRVIRRTKRATIFALILREGKKGCSSTPGVISNTMYLLHGSVAAAAAAVARWQRIVFWL